MRDGDFHSAQWDTDQAWKKPPGLAREAWVSQEHTKAKLFSTAHRCAYYLEWEKPWVVLLAYGSSAGDLIKERPIFISLSTIVNNSAKESIQLSKINRTNRIVTTPVLTLRDQQFTQPEAEEAMCTTRGHTTKSLVLGAAKVTFCFTLKRFMCKGNLFPVMYFPYRAFVFLQRLTEIIGVSLTELIFI